MTNKFYSQLVYYYSEIKIPKIYEELGQIGKYITWYLADAQNQFIHIQENLNYHIIDLDIKSAFPTICNNLFGKTDFTDHMNKLTDKKERNIFIATTLKDTGWLPIINSICNMVILGSIIELCDSPDLMILELKKDGALIRCNRDDLYNIYQLKRSNSNFIKFIMDCNFIFHTTQYSRYYRTNKTSTFIKENDIIVKGIYKHIPLKTFNVIKELLLENKEINEKGLLEVYSQSYFDIIKLNNITELLNDWYFCGQNRVLNSQLKYEQYHKNVSVDSRLYLKTFIFPTILGVKMGNVS